MKIWSIYALSDPRTGKPRYVGCSKKEPEVRRKEHVKGTNTSTREWVMELRASGLEPFLMVIAQAPDKLGGHQTERDLIRKLIGDGERLLNKQHSGIRFRKNRRPESGPIKIGLRISAAANERITALQRQFKELTGYKISLSKIVNRVIEKAPDMFPKTETDDEAAE